MKNIILISMAICLLWLAGYFVFHEEAKIKNAPSKNESILIFGDSLAEGVGATNGNDLSSRLEEKLGRRVLNFGRSGDTTRDALGRISGAAQEGAGTVVVILGGNDVLKKIPKEETFRNLEKIITSFQDTGSVVVLVGVRSGLVGDGRGEDFKSLAQKTGSIYISDILQDVFADSSQMADLIHPNDAGYAAISERIAPILAGLWKKGD